MNPQMRAPVQKDMFGNPIVSSTWAIPQAPKKQRGKGGFLSSLISEIGGAGGAAGGAALGTALLPGLGTILGAGVGGLLGGTGGRGVENKIRDNQNFFGEGGSARTAFGEGALSGVLGGAGTAFQVAKAAKGVTGLRGANAVKTATKSTPEAFKTALRGGVPGGVDDVTKIAKLSAGKNASTRSGQSMYRATLGIDDIIMPGKQKPGTIFKADELLNEARKTGLKGTPKAMQRQVASQYDLLNQSVDDILSASSKTTSSRKLLTQARSEILDKLPLKVDGVPVRSELLRSVRQIADLSQGGKVSAKVLHQFKNTLDVDSAFKKLSGEVGSSLTAKETVDLALWKQADKWITELAPAAKELTARQSRLYGLAQGLGRMTRTPGDPKSVVDLAARVVGPGVRKAQNALGRGLMTTGGVQSGASGALPGALGTGLGQSLKQGMFQAPGALSRAMSGGNEQLPETDYAPTDSQPVMFEDGTMGMSGVSPELEQPQPQSLYSLERALQDIQRDPKNRADYLAIYKTVSDAEEAQNPKLSAAEKKAKQQASVAIQGLSQLRNLYTQAGGGQGRVGGILGNITGKAGQNSEANAYNQIRNSLTTTLARAFGETGVLTDQDREVYLQALPRLEDNPQEAQIKLQYLEDMLADAGTGGANTQTQPQEQYQYQGGY